MPPAFFSDKPGDCKICGMRLVPMKASPRPGERKVLFYRSPMDPSVRSDTPMKDSMGMDFVPVYADGTGNATTVDGRAAITLSPEKRQLLGIRTEAVARASLK